MCHRPHQIEVTLPNKVTKKNLHVSFKVGGVWVLTWLNFPHQRIFELGCPELQGISWWVVEVRGLWAEWVELPASAPPPSEQFCSSEDFVSRDPESVQVRLGEMGMGNDYLFNNNIKKGHKPLKGLNSPAQTRMSCKASPGGGHTASA